MATKPTPTLADNFADWLGGARKHPAFRAMRTERARKKYIEQAAMLGDLMRRANRFKLENDFLDAAVEIASTKLNTPRKIEDTVRLARLPFPVTFIEFSNDERMKRQRELGTMEGTDPAKDSPRGQAGFLIEQDGDEPGRYRALYIASGEIMVGAVAYLLDINAEDEDALLKHRWFFDGRADTDDPVELAHLHDDNMRVYRAIPYGIRVDGGSIGASPYLLHSSVPTMAPLATPLAMDLQSEEEKNRLLTVLRSELWEGRGDLRLLPTIIAMIDEIPVQYLPVSPGGTRLHKGKLRPYFSHKVVTLTYPRSQAVKRTLRALNAASVSRRRGPVRGHYRHIKSKDGPKRVWVRSHMRGDASKGWVYRSYDVEAGPHAALIVPRESDAPVKEHQDSDEVEIWRKNND